MRKIKFSKPPYKVDVLEGGEVVIIEASGEEVIAMIPKPTNKGSFEEKELVQAANARLLKSAPVLLDACARALCELKNPTSLKSSVIKGVQEALCGAVDAL